MKAPSFKAPSIKVPTFKKPAVKRDPLPSMAKAPDPLKGVKLPDDIEESPQVELTAVQKGFRERAAQEADRFQDATDSGYYFCGVFANRAQLDAFLDYIGMKGKGDLFIDGREMCAALGIQLPPAEIRPASRAKIDKDFANLVR